MTEARKITLEFLFGYLEYLSKWNKSASLISIIKSKKLYMESSTDSDMSELESVANFEWDDTVRNFSNGDKIMSLNDMYNLLIKENRDKKLNDLLN